MDDRPQNAEVQWTVFFVDFSRGTKDCDFRLFLAKNTSTKKNAFFFRNHHRSWIENNHWQQKQMIFMCFCYSDCGHLIFTVKNSFPKTESESSIRTSMQSSMYERRYMYERRPYRRWTTLPGVWPLFSEPLPLITVKKKRKCRRSVNIDGLLYETFFFRAFDRISSIFE